MTKTSPRADTAYQALRRAIIEHALRPGTKLPEDEIGSHFGMSRTLVRATLARLQSEGLVDTRPRRSATAAKLMLKEAKEVFAMRFALEREAVRLVVENWKPEFGAILDGNIREGEAVAATSDACISIRLACEFHITLASLTDNTLLRSFLGELVSCLLAHPRRLPTTALIGLRHQRAPGNRGCIAAPRCRSCHCVDGSPCRTER